MSRLDIKTPSRAQTVVEGLYRDMERRIAASPPGLCPVDMSLSFLQLCHAQTCGKCVPCRIGLGQLTLLINQVLDGEATMETIAIIEKTARSIVNTADCAIGRDAARLVVEGLEGFRDDYEEHVKHNRCLAGLQNPVPCVALCPAGVDIPGYMALVGEGRCADAVRLIRKDNPFPTACAYICEHPCEARCRRNMVDDAINIRGLKRYAVDHALAAEGAVGLPQGAVLPHADGGVGTGTHQVPYVHPLHLIADLDTAHTADAAVLDPHHGIAEIRGDIPQVLDVVLPQQVIVVGQLLKTAVAAAGTLGAADLMLAQQQPQVHPAGLPHTGRVGMDHHALGHHVVAGGDQALLTLHLHDAQAAGTDFVDLLEIAHGGDLDACSAGGLQNGGTLRHGNGPIVDGQCYHFSFRPPLKIP